MGIYYLTSTGRLYDVNRQTESAIRSLRRLPYREYLRTHHWRRTRELALERAGHRCALCPSCDFLSVHHRSYLRLGFEQPQDLIVLCRECHERHHQRIILAAIRATDMRCAIYARVSTFDQQPENQLAELRRYVEARGWTAVEYVDKGVSGAKDRRPGLDQLVMDARRRRFDVLICWRLDRLGRNLRHLVVMLEELQTLGVAFVSLAEGIDATTPAGKLQMHILAAIAEFERARIAERVKAGLSRVRAAGQTLGRPLTKLSPAAVDRTAHLSIRKAALELAVPRSVLHRARVSRNRLRKSA
jgi:DNA invertase Pin-like site-specific DNA recombinase